MDGRMVIMDGLMHVRWMDEWMYVCGTDEEGWLEGRMDASTPGCGWMDGCVNRRRRIDRWVDG